MIDKFLCFLKRNNYSENTINTYRSVLNSYEKDLCDLRKIKNRIVKNMKHPATAHLHYNVILSFFKWSKDKRINQIKLLRLNPIESKYLQVFNKEYLLNKTEVLPTDTNKTIQKKSTIRFLFETGIRADELRHIKFVNQDILLVFGKGNKTREIFYNYETFEKMGRFKYSTKTLRIWTKEILGNQYTPHSIRRSHATHMLLNGANPKTVMLQLGHSKIETTFRYLHLNAKSNKEQYIKYY